jgi:uncharacterized protein
MVCQLFHRTRFQSSARNRFFYLCDCCIFIRTDYFDKERLEIKVMSQKRIVMFLLAVLLTTVTGQISLGQSQEREAANKSSEGRDEYGRTPLMRAVEQGDAAEVFALLSAGADVEARKESGVTAVMNAAGRGRKDILEALIEKGADINAKTTGGFTALMSAALNGQTEIIKTLLEKGVDFKAKDGAEQTALMYATLKEHFEIVELLKQAGAIE